MKMSTFFHFMELKILYIIHMRKRITLDDFIKRSNDIYNNKYDYSLVKSDITTRKLIKIICPIHGEFETLAGSHIKGDSSCPKCSKDKLKKDFLKKSIDKHGNKYDYSLVDYKNNDSNVKIICPVHGEFEQIPHHHTQGAGCSKCMYDNKRSNTKKFIERSKKIHGDKYDYSLVEYKGAYDKVKIVCPIHGEFEQKPCDHINGYRGCPKCGGTMKSNTNDFIEKAKKVHKDKFDYSAVNYNLCTEPIKIICKKHGEFEQMPTSHLSGNGCPICNQSKGEERILNFLNENDYIYIYQKRFNKCKNISCLPFDFYLPEYNICIEYDGIQHFEPVQRFGGEIGFKKTQINDNIKDYFCKNNNIKLLRIKYDENIIEKLKKYLDNYGNTIIQTNEKRNKLLLFSKFGK